MEPEDVPDELLSLLYIDSRACLMFWSGFFRVFLLLPYSVTRVLTLLMCWSMVLLVLAM